MKVYNNNMTYLNYSAMYNKKIQRYTTTERQDLTDTFSTALGSEITYEPFSITEKVLYEYITSWTYKDTTSKINFRILEYNNSTSSWDVINGSHMTIKTLRSGSNQVCVKFLLNGWENSKQLKVECKEDSSSLEGYLHSNLENTKFFDPIVSCTGIQ